MDQLIDQLLLLEGDEGKKQMEEFKKKQTLNEFKLLCFTFVGGDEYKSAQLELNLFLNFSVLEFKYLLKKMLKNPTVV